MPSRGWDQGRYARDPASPANGPGQGRYLGSTPEHRGESWAETLSRGLSRGFHPKTSLESVSSGRDLEILMLKGS